DKIVLGRSLNYKGEPNLIMKRIKLFKKQLEKAANLDIVYEDETLTTAEARRPLRGERMRPPIANKRKKMTIAKKTVDASAAALILKSFLDKKMLK
ncbi:MAG: Holliday junction resolvase RuvX, partial [Patescibacteria group bacterium]